jgi:hypothetical protein
MLLGARFLQDVGSVNSWCYALQSPPQWTQGDTVDLYFQLLDTTKETAVSGFKPAGRRYCAAANSSLSVTLTNIDDALQLTRSCTQPFVNDSSIWMLSILASDGIQGSTAMVLTLNENGVITRGRTECGPRINSQGTL